MTNTIEITAAARTYIKTYVAKNNGVALRLSIKKTGCSGYSYAPTVVSEMNPNDQRTDIEGITILLDTVWLHLLQGIKIDYIEEDKSGLKQKRLVFINPKETGRCGCGESFHAS